MRYQTLLLDADGTLMDFLAAEAQGIRNTFLIHHLPFDENILRDYSEINKKCWEEFEQGLLDKKTLLVERFRRLFVKYQFDADPDMIRITYGEELGKGAFMIPYAYEVCEELAGSYDLYIVTNGVAFTQKRRFHDCGLDRLVKGVFISEELGYQKPQKEFFNEVFARIPSFDKERTLMIGDSLSADIQGGINAGIDTCWYNPDYKDRPEHMQITYVIHDIRELLTL